MWAQICVGYMRVSRLQAKGCQHHLSQNIGPVIAGSASPAPPTLSERNECVKGTAYGKSGAAKAAPATPLPTALTGRAMKTF